MARKNRMIFTDNRQSKRGIMSVVLGVICLLSLAFGIIASYKLEGEVGVNFGAALFVTLVMSVTGIALGVSARMDSGSFKLLPNIGTAVNAVVIIVLAFLLWIGLR